MVPDVIRPLFPQKEIRRSLQTRCRREALIRGRELLLQVQHLFTEAFQGARPSLERLRGAWEAGGKRVASWASWLRQQQLVSFQQASLIAEPQRNAERPAPRRQEKSAVSLVPDQPDLGPRFSEVVEEHLRHQVREGVALKTIDDKRAVANLLIRIIGDQPISLITRKEAHQFRETALKLPSRINQLSNQSIEQAIEEATSTISPTTFNNYAKNLTTFFSYAIREGYCERNPFDGLRIKQRKKVSEERSTFSGPLYGARLNELCQLYVDDEVVINGVDCLHIREGRPDQKLKTVSSERLVPLHSRLKTLGFLEYVDKQRAAGQARVFSGLTRHKMHGYAAGPPKWFSCVRQQLGFRSDVAKKDFNSFRYTLADHLKQKGI